MDNFNSNFERVAATKPFNLAFQTTFRCNYNCAHCLDNCGPNRKNKYMPKKVIKDYVSQAKENVKFINAVILTGGELFLNYFHNDRHYVPDLIEYLLDYNIETNIKTNGGWVFSNKKDMIFDDLSQIDTNSRLEISLSLDEFHPNSLTTSTKIINHLVLSGNRINFSITSFKGNENMFNLLIKNIQEKHSIKELSNPNKLTFNKSRRFILGEDNNRLRADFGYLYNLGRAENLKSNKIAMKTPSIKYFFIHNDITTLAFDVDGFVGFDGTSPDLIRTRWQNRDGSIKSLENILSELAFEVKKAEFALESQITR